MRRPVQGASKRDIGNRAAALARFGDGAQARLALALDLVGGKGGVLRHVGKQSERVKVARQRVDFKRSDVAPGL